MKKGLEWRVMGVIVADYLFEKLDILLLIVSSVLLKDKHSPLSLHVKRYMRLAGEIKHATAIVSRANSRNIESSIRLCSSIKL